jgi:hypothetical protein
MILSLHLKYLLHSLLITVSFVCVCVLSIGQTIVINFLTVGTDC